MDNGQFLTRLLLNDFFNDVRSDFGIGKLEEEKKLKSNMQQ